MIRLRRSQRLTEITTYLHSLLSKRLSSHQDLLNDEEKFKTHQSRRSVLHLHLNPVISNIRRTTNLPSRKFRVIELRNSQSHLCLRAFKSPKSSLLRSPTITFAIAMTLFVTLKFLTDSTKSIVVKSQFHGSLGLRRDKTLPSRGNWSSRENK